MSVTLQTPYNRYTGNGATMVFPYQFQILAATDLAGYIGGSLKVNVADYTVSNVGAVTGGNVTFLVAPANGTLVTLARAMRRERLTDYQQLGDFLTPVVNPDFDRAILLSQDTNASVGRAIHAPDYEVTANMLLPPAATRALTNLGFDASGNVAVSLALASGTLSQATIGAFLYPITAAEIAASVTPTNFGYPPNNVLRYGISAANSAATNTAAAQALWKSSITNGPTGTFIFPNVSGADIYLFNDILDFRDGCSLDLNNCTLSFTKTVPTAHDTAAGFIFAVRNFSIYNGTLIVTYPGGLGGAQGCPLAFGARGNDAGLGAYFQNSYDSLMAVPQGNISVKNLRIQNNTAANFAIWLTGGLQNCSFENLWIDGMSNAGDGIYGEFGWATQSSVGDPAQSTRQTSHGHNLSFKNIHIRNTNLSALSAGGISYNGAYNVFADGIYINNVTVGMNFGCGEAAFYRPWAGVDDVGGKRDITLRNIHCRNVKGSAGNALVFGGCTAVNSKQGIGGAGTSLGYLGNNWTQSTAYVAGMTAYSANSGNIYLCATPGTSSNAGTGPAGTGNGIADGTATWNYIPNSTWVDLFDVDVDGFTVDCTGITNNGIGVLTSAGRTLLKNGTVNANSSGQAFTNGIRIFDECTNFSIDNVRVLGAQQAGMILGSGSGMPNTPPTTLFSPQRLKNGSVSKCYIAGCSASSAGTFSAIQINNADGILIEANRIGYDVAYSGVAETVQGNAVNFTNLTLCSDVIVRGNHVGGVAAGVIYAYQQSLGGGTFNNGCTLTNNTGLNTSIGYWKDGNDSSNILTYSASMTPDVSTGINHFIITATNNTAFTINTPVNNALVMAGSQTNFPVGRKLKFTIRNTSGGALGAITWNAFYKVAFTSPATANSRTVEFYFDGTNLVQDYVGSVDVPN